MSPRVTVHVAHVLPSGRSVWPGHLDPATDQVLDAGERARLSRLRAPAAAARYALAHRLLRAVVGEATGQPAAAVRFRRACAVCGSRTHGRPEVEPVRGRPVPSVSLSSAGDLVVVALSPDAVVGLDVASVAAVAEHGLARLAGDDAPADPLPLARWWVRREAVLKATGHGLGVEPSDLRIEGADDPRLVAWRGRDLPAVGLADLQLGPGLVACVATLGPHPPAVVLG